MIGKTVYHRKAQVSQRLAVENVKKRAGELDILGEAAGEGGLILGIQKTTLAGAYSTETPLG